MINNRARVTAIFIALTLCTIAIIIIDLFLSPSHKNKSIVDYTLYWTHWSVFAAQIWFALLFAAVHSNNEEMLMYLNSWHSKGIVTSFVLTAGFVVFLAALFFLFYLLINMSFVEKIQSTSIFLMICTILKHLVIQILLFLEYVYGYRLTGEIEKQKGRKQIALSLILPNIYFIFVVYFVSQGATPPYPVFWFAEKIFIVKSWYFHWISIISCLLICLIFVFLYKILLVLDTRLNKQKQHKTKIPTY